ncbi:hypothetical protein T484DRAFT_1971560 [Baffinella frigidus]|nr:hypothetical protein T484DRAFT_1971560 [Cryptophyta sp. CCMP2293]
MCTTSLALPTTTAPPSPLVHSVAFCMRAVQEFSAEQGFWPQHPPETHDASLARNHAESPPSVSLLGTTLISSSDLLADRDSDHQVGDECDKHAPPETSSRSSVAFMRALQTVCCRERGRAAASSRHASDHEPCVDSGPPSPRSSSPPPARRRYSSGAVFQRSADWQATLDWCKATARDGGNGGCGKSPVASRASSQGEYV